MLVKPIKLVCRYCDKTIDYIREIDVSIPANVVRIEQPNCDECWGGGDYQGEDWFDAAGCEVSQKPLSVD